MTVYDGLYDDYVEADDFDQLVCKVDAISNVVSILIDVLGENWPVLYENLMNNIRHAITCIRSALGAVSEDDIAEYAYLVTEHMNRFLPVDEDRF
ncbi:hypothetical protein [Escherichia coli]|uniref:hypothetical protein n=1 Tax=Escherichia coli TaxID=562 RepID=UPI0015C4DF14|nr:hypothetical protein [Escherichia coli]